MKKINKILKVVLIIFLTSSFLFLLFIKLFYLKNYSFLWEEYFYLWLLLCLIYFIWVFKLSSRKIFLYSIYGYVLGVMLTLMHLNNIAEGVFRLTFIGLFVGTLNALIEYRRNKQ